MSRLASTVRTFLTLPILCPRASWSDEAEQRDKARVSYHDDRLMACLDHKRLPVAGTGRVPERP
jgi:hypothetical protein